MSELTIEDFRELDAAWRALVIARAEDRRGDARKATERIEAVRARSLLAPTQSGSTQP